MDHQFWHDRWASRQIGFHEGVPNDLLVTHFQALGLGAGARVLVPLCGKSIDLHWLMGQGMMVVGVELSRSAIEELFDENGMTPEIRTQTPFEVFSAPGIDIFVGDILDLDAHDLGPIDAIYDRAALVALPEPIRGDYAAHLTALAPHAPRLLITFEYDQNRMEGPPFSLNVKDIESLFGRNFTIETLETRAIDGRLAERSGGAFELALRLLSKSTG